MSEVLEMRNKKVFSEEQKSKIKYNAMLLGASFEFTVFLMGVHPEIELKELHFNNKVYDKEEDLDGWERYCDSYQSYHGSSD